MRRITVLFAAVLVQAAPALAQAGSIPVTIYITSGGETAGVIAALELSITRLDGDSSVVVTTDSLGQATTRLAPGRYRIRSLNPVRRGGEVYSWDIEATVRTSDRSVIVSLNRQNAALGIDFASLPRSATAVQAKPIQSSVVPQRTADDSAAFVAFKAGGIYYRNVTRCEATRIPKDADRTYFRSAEDAQRLGLMPSKEAGCQ